MIPFGKSLMLTIIVSLAVSAMVSCLILLLNFIGQSIGAPNDDFTNLSGLRIVALLAIGAVLLVGINFLSRVDGREVGVIHSLASIAFNDAKFPIKNALTQLGSVVVGLSAGFVGGREGPALHLGAWLGSRFGIWEKNDEIRLLLVQVSMVAALAAGLHTMVAAFFFAIEVFRSPLHHFKTALALIIAAAVGTSVSGWFGVEPLIEIEYPNNALSWREWVYMFAIGLSASFCAVLFHLVLSQASKVDSSYWNRIAFLTILTAAVGIFLPEALGIGYHLHEVVVSGQFEQGLFLLSLLTVVRLLLSAVGSGLGLPLGVIGPTFVNGALLGAVAYFLLQTLAPEWVKAPIEIYSLTGAVVLLGCTLNTPHTAFLLFVELTTDGLAATAQIAFVIYIAYLCKIKALGKYSVFESRLAIQGIQVRERLEEISRNRT